MRSAAGASSRCAPTSGSRPTTRKLGQPEILLGVIPGAGGTQRLTRLVGPAKAKDIIFTGRFVGAEEALAIGMVDRVVPAAEVYETAVAWAAKFANGPAYALRAAKEAIDRGIETDLDTGLEIERQQFASLFATRGPGDRDEVVRREGPRQGRVRRPLTRRRVPGGFAPYVVPQLRTVITRRRLPR